MSERSRLASPLQLDLAQQISAMIRDGAASSGDHLTEEALAQQLEVSRSPVRAALRLLEERGIVEKRANAGVYVTEGAAGLAAEFLGDDDIVNEETLYSSIIADRANDTLGDTLSENELMSRYGATKRPLHRVLLRMNREGLVERRKGRGWQFLPRLDSETAKNESYRIRLILECASLREPTFRVDPAELRRVREAHENFLKLKPEAQNPFAFFEMSAAFHEMLGLFSGNRFFHEVISKQSKLRRFEEFAAYNRGIGRLDEAAREHLEIINAIDRGDLEWAEALLRRHLTLASTF
jgi:DNA-binding GntR family transcriptional regulator